MHLRLAKTYLGFIALLLGAGLALAGEAESPFVGHWALTLPDGGVGWLGIVATNNTLKGSVLWGTGDVEPVADVTVEDQRLQFAGDPPEERAQVLTVTGDVLVLVREHAGTAVKAGRVVPVKEYETIRATRSGERLELTTEWQCEGRTYGLVKLTGSRLPPLPPAPDLARVRFGEPLRLFNGRDLTGWRLARTNQVNGWRVEDGVLANRLNRANGPPFTSSGNLRTDREFEDFRLTCETRLPTNGNSGVYLRGIYEIQVADTFGKPRNAHSMGALYSRLTPSVNAEKPAGAWQTLAITLVDRHVTVVLNGITIIANQPALGCTGGALWADVWRPGPICLQGDHTAIEFRNLVLQPVVKEPKDSPP